MVCSRVSKVYLCLFAVKEWKNETFDHQEMKPNLFLV